MGGIFRTKETQPELYCTERKRGRQKQTLSKDNSCKHLAYEWAVAERKIWGEDTAFLKWKYYGIFSPW